MAGSPGRCWSAGGTYDSPQMSHAASRHTELIVFGPYKNQNVFHELYKPRSRISFTLRCSIDSSFYEKSTFILQLYRNISGLVYNLNIRHNVSSIVVKSMRSQALS